MERSAYYRAKWEPHRRVMAEVLRVAPRVKPGSVVVLTNVSHSIDPLVNGMWYDVALRLAYPHIRVGGAFFYNDGAPTTGNTYEAAGDRWQPTRDAWAPQLKDARIEDTIVIDLAGAHATLSTTMPRAACPAGCASSAYHPEARLLPGPPTREAIARYGPISQ